MKFPPISKFILEGDPISFVRPKYFTDGTYDAQKHRKLVAGITLSNQFPYDRLIDKPIHLEITFFMPKPYGTYVRYGTPHTHRPDLSHLMLYIEDALTGIVILDKNLIVSMFCCKKYDKHPRTEFTITIL